MKFLDKANSWIGFLNLGFDTVQKVLTSFRKGVEEDINETGELKKRGFKIKREKENEEWTSLKGKKRWEFLKRRSRSRNRP